MFESLLHIKILFSPVDKGDGGNVSIKEKQIIRNNEELTEVNKRLVATNEELISLNKELTEANSELKTMIQELTGWNQAITGSNQDLRNSNQELRISNQEFRISNLEFRTSNQEIRKSNQGLTASNQELTGWNQDLTTSNQALKRLNQQLAEARRTAFNLLEDAQVTEAQLATDLSNMRLLVELSERLISENNIREQLPHILNAAITFTKAGAGTIQMLNTKTQQLEVVATKGFSKNFVNYFEFVDASSNTPCGIALRKNERVFIDFNVPPDQDPDGSLRMHVEEGFLSAQSTPLIGHSGTAIGMISTHFKRNHRPNDRELYFIDLLARQTADMIERKNAEEIIRKSQEQLQKFNTILEEQVKERTDELKNFNHIAANNYAETLRHVYINLETIVTTDARNLSNSSRANIRRAQAAVQKMKLLTNDINHYLELYDVEFKKELTDPNEILIYVKEKMQKKIEDSNATINIAKLPKLSADSLLFSTVMTNIIDNSIKFKRPDADPVIDISSSLIADASPVSKTNDNKAYTIITVKDTGIGFNQEDAEKAFELFTQLDEKHKGSGIGLAICKKIMEMHGGFIRAESEHDKGTSILCYFPA